MYQNTLAFLFP